MGDQIAEIIIALSNQPKTVILHQGPTLTRRKNKGALCEGIESARLKGRVTGKKHEEENQQIDESKGE